jgi:hypothetical protein
MSHDLRHSQEWETTLPEQPKYTEEDNKLFNVMVWSCGMGWTIRHTNLFIEEARGLKIEYACKDIEAKIYLEVE